MESKNLFGCNYLKHKDDGYYILNQKVDEKSFKKLTKEITKELDKKDIYTFHDLIHKNINVQTQCIASHELNRNCTLCDSEFQICNKEIEFYKERDIKLPIYCSNCRANQRVKLRNDRTMYKRKCDKCKDTLITTYPDNSPYIIYCLDCWLNNFN